jgi:hypothetical protein
MYPILYDHPHNKVPSIYQNIIQSNYTHIAMLSFLQGVMFTLEESKIVVAKYWTDILYIMA